MNTNKSFSVLKNLKFFLCVYIKISGYCPFKSFIKNNFSGSRYTCLEDFEFFQIFMELFISIINKEVKW
jgi:hypothetical protein